MTLPQQPKVETDMECLIQAKAECPPVIQEEKPRWIWDRRDQVLLALKKARAAGFREGVEKAADFIEEDNKSFEMLTSGRFTLIPLANLVRSLRDE